LRFGDFPVPNRRDIVPQESSAESYDGSKSGLRISSAKDLDPCEQVVARGRHADEHRLMRRAWRRWMSCLARRSWSWSGPKGRHRKLGALVTVTAAEPVV